MSADLLCLTIRLFTELNRRLACLRTPIIIPIVDSGPSWTRSEQVIRPCLTRSTTLHRECLRSVVGIRPEGRDTALSAAVRINRQASAVIIDQGLVKC